MNRLLSVALASAVTLLLASWTFGFYPPHRRVHDVQIANFEFQPEELAIAAGDRVRWTDAAGHPG